MAQPSRREKSAESGEAASVPLTVVPIRVDVDVDALDGFKPEHAADESASAKSAPAKPTRVRTPAEQARLRLLLITTAAALTAAAASGGVYRQFRSQKAAPAAAAFVTGKAVLQTRPDGATVVVDGAKRGITPLELELPVGSHAVIFQHGGAER